jgi:glucose/mannose transport system substrate-binding protein
LETREETDIMKHFLTNAAALAIAASALAAPAMAADVDVVHWLVSPGESKAIKVLAEATDATGNKWVDNAVAGGGAGGRTIVANRYAGGNPPGAFYGQPGPDMHKMADADMLQTTQSVAEAENWDSVLLPIVSEYLKHNGQYSAIPLGLSAHNWMWYSKKIFDEVGVKPPATWAEFIQIAPKIKAAGYVPLVVGGDAWQEAMIFRSVLAEVGGIDFYKKVYIERNAEAAGGETMVKTLELFRKLREFTDQGAGRKWNDATRMVIENKAAIQLMGDWAKGEFAARNLKPQQDFGCDLAPGTRGTYYTAIDVLLLGKLSDPARTKAQMDMAKAIVSPDTQAKFGIAKGEIPVRKDVDTSGYDACAQIAIETVKNPANVVPIPDLVLSPDTFGQINDTMSEFWHNDSVTTKEAASQIGDIIGSAL